MSDEEVRFSDEALTEFHQEFLTHKTTVEGRINDLITAQENNTRAIEELVKETRGIVTLYNNIQGAAKLGDSVQRFGLWLLKWPLIGAGLYAMYNWLLDHFSK